MLVSFIGCPMSGKTTVAAKVFASLKESGKPAELLTEQARLYIARQRVQNVLHPQDRLELTPEDQVRIMFNQVRWERTLLQASGSDVYVITDTSPLNTLLYMPPDLRETPEVQGLVKAALELEEVYDGVSFYCLPVPEEQGHDPNRIHDAKQSAAINAIIPEVMTAYAPELWGGVIRLDGDLEDRFQTARANVLPAVRR